MAEADGKIIIDTEIDDKNVIEGIRKMSSKSIKLANDITKIETQIKSLEAAMKKMEKTRLNQKEFDQLKIKTEEAAEELNALYEEAKRYERSIQIPGLSESEMERVYEQDKKWKEIAGSIEAAEQKLENYQKKLAYLENDNTMQSNTMEYRIKSDKLDYAKAKLEELKRKQEELPSSAERIGKSIDKIGSTIGKGAKTGIKYLGKMGQAGKSAFKIITGGTKKSKKSTDSMNKSFWQSAKLMAKMAGTALFFQGFFKVTQAIGETIGELTVKDKAFSKSLAQLKANLATSFTPIWNAALPGIKAMVNWLSLATAKLGGFLSAMTGAKSTSMKGSVGETADEMEKLAKKTEKANHQLNSYDKLNVRSKKDKDEDDTKEGVTTSGVTAGNWDNLVKKLKDSWKKQDFTWLGKLLANKINHSMQNIPWKDIKKQAKRIAKCIGTFFNGFIGKINWKLLGKTMAEGLNTAIVFLNTLLTTLKWGKLGIGIANAMNGFLKRTDWSGAGKVIRNALNAVFSLANTWSKKFDFSLLGSSIAECINSAIVGINWRDALEAGTNFGKGIAEAANSFISKTDFYILGKTVADFIKVGVNGWYANVTTFNFKNLGKKIGDSINGFLKEMNKVDDKTKLSGWQKLGESITAQIGGIVDTIIYALDTVNWEEVGTSIGTFLAKLDWLGLLGKVAKAIWLALNGALKAWESWFKAEPVSAAIVAAIVAVITVGKFLKIAKNISNIFKGAEFEGVVKKGASSLGEKIGGIFRKKTKTELGSKVTSDKMADGISASMEKTGKSSKIKKACGAIGKIIGVYLAAEISAEVLKSAGNLATGISKDLPDNTPNNEADSASDVFASYGKIFGGIGETISSLLNGDWEGIKNGVKKTAKGFMPAIYTEDASVQSSSLDKYTSGTDKKSKALKKLRQQLEKLGAGSTDILLIMNDVSKAFDKGTISTEELNEVTKKQYSSYKDLKNEIGLNGVRATSRYTEKQNELQKKMKNLNITSESQGDIFLALNNALDKGEISWSDYKKLVDGNYKSAKDLQDAINKLNPKSIKVEAKVSGKKDVDDTKNSVNGIKDKKISVTADASGAKREIGNIPSSKTVSIQSKVDQNSAKTAFEKIKSLFEKNPIQLNIGTKKASDTIDKYSKLAKMLSQAPAILKEKPELKNGVLRIPNGKNSYYDKLIKFAKKNNIPIERFAKGGFPKKAQLFFAREDGKPEFVGMQGSKTAVANNDQIVESVSDGVYRAAYAAMQALATMKIPTIEYSIPNVLETALVKYSAYTSTKAAGYTNPVPALATGTAIPLNQQLQNAVNNSGGTQAEEIANAVVKRLEDSKLAAPQTISISMDGREVYNVVVTRDREHRTMYGKSGMAVN